MCDVDCQSFQRLIFENFICWVQCSGDTPPLPVLHASAVCSRPSLFPHSTDDSFHLRNHLISETVVFIRVLSKLTTWLTAHTSVSTRHASKSPEARGTGMNIPGKVWRREHSGFVQTRNLNCWRSSPRMSSGCGKGEREKEIKV